MHRSEVSILIVDDVRAVRTHVQDLLITAGFKNIWQASHVPQAKSFLESEPCHLILCDWFMLPTDGLELFRYVRSHAQLKKTGFIFLTGQRLEPQVKAAIQTGVDDYILKPLTQLQIQSKIYGVLLKKQVIS